ncbi:MAG: hypothetical protein V3V27_01945 [Candidatus Thermoplasmatota archaeon]|jgi:hypothetical protein
MAHKRKTDQKKESAPYTLGDAMKITDEVFKLSKENNYHPGAFVHGLIFALEYAQTSYKIPQQQMATIKRDCRKYIKEVTSQRKTDESLQ